MQKFTQKYTIICLLEDVDEGHKYASNNWPLHITLADTFSIAENIEDLEQLLGRLAEQLKPTTARADHYEYFGPGQDIQVTVFDLNDSLKDTHYRIVDSLEELGAIFNDPQYTREGFKPHATVQKQVRVNPGDSVHINNLAIVDMFPNQDGHQRKVLKKFRLE